MPATELGQHQPCRLDLVAGLSARHRELAGLVGPAQAALTDGGGCVRCSDTLVDVHGSIS